MSRCWLAVAGLALCLAGSGLAASIGEEDAVSPSLGPYADSMAASLLKLPPSQRLARWTATREARQVREQSRLFEEVADTLGDELLFAVHQFATQGIEMRLVGRSGWRRVEVPRPPADPDARHDRAHSVPMQLAHRRRTRSSSWRWTLWVMVGRGRGPGACHRDSTTAASSGVSRCCASTTRSCSARGRTGTARARSTQTSAAPAHTSLWDPCGG